MGNDDFNYLEQKREAAYAAVEAKKAKEKEDARKRLMEYREDTKYRQDNISFGLSVASFFFSLAAIIISILK